MALLKSYIEQINDNGGRQVTTTPAATTTAKTTTTKSTTPATSSTKTTGTSSTSKNTTSSTSKNTSTSTSNKNTSANNTNTKQQSTTPATTNYTLGDVTNAATSVLDKLTANGITDRDALVQAAKDYAGNIPGSSLALGTLLGNNSSLLYADSQTAGIAPNGQTAIENFVDNYLNKGNASAGTTASQNGTGIQDFTYTSPTIDSTMAMLDNINSLQTKYSEAVEKAYADYANRAAFSYDSNSDPLFQNYLANMMNSGKTAMQDTMGQAAALTGGYGSTYAETVGNQAYNSYIQTAYDNMQDYYQMALNTYNTESDRLLNNFNMISQMDANTYDRYVTALNSNMAVDDQQFNQQSTAYQINQTNYWNQQDLDYKYAALNQDNTQFYASLNQNQSQFDASQQYKYDALAQDQNQYDSSLAQSKYEFDANQQYKYDAMAQDQSQFNANQQYKYDALAQDQSQYNSDMQYKYDAMAQDQNQFNASQQYKYDAMAQDQAQYESDLQYKTDVANSSSSGTSDESLKTPTGSILKEGRDIYEARGLDALYDFVERYPDYDTTAILEYATKYNGTTEGTAAYNDYEARQYSKSENHWGSGNDVVSDAYGNSYTISEWEALYRDALKGQGIPDTVAENLVKDFIANLKKAK